MTEKPSRNQRKKRLLIGTLAFVLMPIAGCTTPVAGAQPSARLDWSMPHRYVDVNNDGDLDYLTTEGQVNPPNWHVTLDGCASVTTGHTLYSWAVHVPGPKPVRFVTSDCKTSFEFPALGTYPVDLMVTNDRSFQSSTTTRAIIVKDFLIVSMGDSVASGEGNPDHHFVPGAPTLLPAGVPNEYPYWHHWGCHRSVTSGAAMAASRIEQHDPHFSVSFLDVACSGAWVQNLYMPQTDANGVVQPPQLDQVKSLVGDRHIDALIITAGANDLGFADIVEDCALYVSCDKHIDGIAGSGSAFDVLRSRTGNLSWCARLSVCTPGHYQILDDYLTGRIGSFVDGQGVPLVEPSHVFLTEYYDPSQDGAANYCRVNVGLAGISSSEMEWASLNLIQPLNDWGSLAAKLAGWSYVGGISRQFIDHGECANDHWVLTFSESLSHQGDKKGFLHPNVQGHRVYAYQIYGALIPALSSSVRLGAIGLPLNGTPRQATFDGVSERLTFNRVVPYRTVHTYAFPSVVSDVASPCCTRYVAALWNGTSYVQTTLPSETVMVTTDINVTHYYARQFLLTVRIRPVGANGIHVATHVLNGQRALAIVSTGYPLSEWLNANAALALSVDDNLSAASGAQLFFEVFSPVPPNTLTAPFGTTAIYKTMPALINDGVAGHQMSAIAASSYKQLFAFVESDIGGQQRVQALSDLQTFISTLQADSVQNLDPAFEGTLLRHAAVVYHTQLCLAKGQNAITPQRLAEANAYYSQLAAQSGVQPLPPC